MTLKTNNSHSDAPTQLKPGILLAVGAVALGGVYVYIRRKQAKTKLFPSEKDEGKTNNNLCKKEGDVATKPHAHPFNKGVASGERGMVTVAPITHLFIHPIKSCGGYEVASADLLPRGLAYDREWVIIRRRDSQVMTIYDIPTMRRVGARVEKSAWGNKEGEEGGTPSPVLVITYRPLAKKSTRNDENTGNGDEEDTDKDEKKRVVEEEEVRIPIFDMSLGSNNRGEKEEIPISIWGMDGTVCDEGKVASEFLTRTLNEARRVALARRAAAAAASLPLNEKEGGGEGESEGEEGEGTEDEEYFLGRFVAPRDPKNGTSSAMHVLDANLRIRGQGETSLHILTEESLAWVTDAVHRAKAATKRKEDLSFPFPSPFPSPPLRIDVPSVAALYRPNIVVKGVPFAEEDCWDTMAVVPASEIETQVAGSKSKKNASDNIDNTTDDAVSLAAQHAPIQLKTQKLCDRCTIPTTDLDGRRDRAFMPTRLLREVHALPASPNSGNPNKGILGLNVNARLKPSNECAADDVDADGRTLRGSVGDDSTLLGRIHVGDYIVVTSYRDVPNYI